MQRLLIAILAVALSSGTYADRDDDDDDDRRKDKHSPKQILKKLRRLERRVSELEAQVPPASASVTVDCDAGETLADALATPAVELEISFSGTCLEELDIDRADVSITGALGAVIEGSIDVNDGGDVVLTSMGIVNAPGVGLFVGHAGRVRASGLDVSGAVDSGALVVGGAMTCGDCTFNDNSEGLVVVNSGRVALGGVIEFIDNTFEGLEIGGSSSVIALIDSTNAGAAGTEMELDASGNGGFGVLLYGSASFRSTDNDTITIDNNPNGMVVASGASAHLIASTVDIVDNGGLGLGVLGGTVFLNATMNASGQSLGVFLDDNGTLRGGGVINATGNTNFGYFVRASVLTDAVVNGSGNTNEMQILLGGTVNVPFSSSIVGEVGCDGTELLSAPFVCGTNPAP